MHNAYTNLKKQSGLRQAHTTLPAHNGSRDVIDHVTIRFAISYRCSIVTRRGSISSRFQDIQPQLMFTNEQTKITLERTNKHN